MEEYKVKVIKNAYQRATESKAWSSLLMMAGEGGREEIMYADKMIELFTELADKHDIELEDKTEDYYQEVFRDAAESFWLAQLVSNISKINPEGAPELTSHENYFRSAKKLLKEEGFEPEYSKDKFYQQTSDRLQEDLYEAELLIDNGMMTTEHEDYQISVNLNEQIQKQLA